MPRAKAVIADGSAQDYRLQKVGEYWLSQRPNSPAWYKTWYNPAKRQTIRESLGTTVLQEAYETLTALVAASPVSDNAPPSRVRLHDVLRWHWENVAKHRTSAAAFNNSFGHWTGYFPPNTVIADLTPIRVSQFVASLRAQHYSEGYIVRIMSDGRAALNWANANELVSRVPKINTGQTRLQVESAPPKGRPLTIDEVARLFAADPAPHVEALMAIMLNTICRPAAARELSPGQIDLTHRLVNLNPPGRQQTAKRRPIVPLTPSLQRTLELIEEREIAAAKRRRDHDFRLTSYVLYRGKPTSKNADAFQQLVERAGFDRTHEQINPYSFRHTVARELRRLRVPSEEISIYLGHQPADKSVMTSVYAPYEPDYLLAASEVVEQYVGRVREAVRALGVEGSIL